MVDNTNKFTQGNVQLYFIATHVRSSQRVKSITQVRVNFWLKHEKTFERSRHTNSHWFKMPDLVKY